MTQENSYWDHFWQRRLSRRRVLQGTVLGSAGLAVAAVIGCSEDEEAATPSATASPGVTAEQPKAGGNLSFVSQASIAPHMDPHQNSFAGLHNQGPAMAYSRLMKWDLTKYPQQLTQTGDLAESWQTPEPTVYIFKLRQGVKFQNLSPVNGRQFTAQDVILSYQRQIAERANAGILASMDKVEAVDDSTVRITLKTPDADFLNAVGDSRSKIVALEAVSVNGDLKNGPTIGTSAWILEEWVPDQRAKMKRNPGYFAGPAPYADSYELNAILDPQTAQAAFRTSQILDIGTNGQVTRLLRQSVPDLRVDDAKLVGSSGGQKLWISTATPIYKDQRVRQAISRLVDREALVRDVVFGSGWINGGIFVPAIDWVLPEGDIKSTLSRDVQMAKQLLSAAGVDLSAWKPTADYFTIPESQAGAELVVSCFKELGVTASLKATDKTEITERIWGRGDMEFYYGSQKGTSPSINSYLYTWVHTRGAEAGVYRLLGDKRFDELVEQQAVILDNPERRKSILLELQKRLIDQAVMLPMYSSNGEVAINPRLQGFKTLSEEPHRYDEMWLKS